jgi:hypothetical protein
METREQVAELRAKGLTLKQIAHSLGLRPVEIVRSAKQVIRVEYRRTIGDSKFDTTIIG